MSRIKKQRRRVWYALLILHVAVCLIAFNKTLFHTDEFLFNNLGDPMKNYFIMDSYLYHDDPKGSLHHNFMNYPFGEYIYYSDNTPLFSWLVKQFSKYLFDIRLYWLLLFHLLVPVSILITARIAWLLSLRFLRSAWMRVLVTIGIPWINIQSQRIQITSNLSYCALLAGCIYLLVRIYEERGSIRKLYKYWIGLFLLVLLSFYLHGYYVMVLGIPVAAFHLFWLAGDFKTPKSVKLVGLALPVIAIALNYLIVRLTDVDFHNRVPGSTGYDWIYWKAQVMGWFTPYEWNVIHFVFESPVWINYESHNYLGAFVLYGLLFMIVWFWYKGKGTGRRFLKKALFESRYGYVLFLLLLTGLFSTILSLGNRTVWLEDTLAFNNVLSPFYWLYRHVPAIGQFRAVGRFGWFLFFPAVFITARLWERLGEQPVRRTVLFKTCTLILATFMLTDVYTRVRHLVNDVYAENPLRAAAVQQTPIGGISAEAFQCILPMPYHTLGADTSGLMIDGYQRWVTFTMQLSKKTNLPLMSSSYARATTYSARSIIKSIAQYRADSTLRVHLNPKPILVAVYKPIANDAEAHVPVVYEPGLSALRNARNFADSLRLPVLFENDSLAYYRWEWNR